MHIKQPHSTGSVDTNWTQKISELKEKKQGDSPEHWTERNRDKKWERQETEDKTRFHTHLKWVSEREERDKVWEFSWREGKNYQNE